MPDIKQRCAKTMIQSDGKVARCVREIGHAGYCFYQSDEAHARTRMDESGNIFLSENPSGLEPQ